MASTMMVTEDISSCEDMEPMDSVIAVHIVFLSIRFVRYKLYLCYIGNFTLGYVSELSIK